METTADRIQDRVGYLGELIQIWRGNTPDSQSALVLRCADGKIRYYDHRGYQILLRPTDRRMSVAVIEDDTFERQDALRAALLEDRWRNVTVRG
jgi:hypothetical protein